MDPSIHEKVAAALSNIGFPAPSNFIQTMLMKDGYFVGWKFRYAGGHTVLSADSGTMELFDGQGKLLKAA